MSVTEAIRRQVGYSEDEDGPVDALIEYKNALEELVDRIDVAATLNARQRSSAADVTAVLFANDLGNMTTRELRSAGLLPGDF